MAFQVSPGVNVSEIDLTTVVPAVATTEAGIVGNFRWGPVEERILIDSENTLVNTFQKPNTDNAEDFFTAASFLAYGNQLWVVRGLPSGGTNSNSANNTGIVIKSEDDYINQYPSGVTGAGNWVAKYPSGVYGDSLKVSICQSANAWSSTLTGNVYATESSTTLLGDEYVATVAISNPSANGTGYANGETVSISEGTSISSATFTIDQVDTNGQISSISILDKGAFYSARPADITNVVLSDPAGGGTAANVSITFAVGTAFSTELTAGDLVVLGNNEVPYRVDSIANNTFATLDSTYKETSSSTATPERRWEFYNYFDVAPGTSEYATTRGGSNDELHIAVVDEDGEWSTTKNEVIEKFDSVSKANDAKTSDGASNYYKTVINNTSKYIWWGNHDSILSNAGGLSSATYSVTDDAPITESMTGGADGSTVADSAYLTGYDLFKNTEEIDVAILIAAAASSTVANHVINNVAEYRKDIIACISPEQADVVNNNATAVSELNDIIDFRNTLPSSSYATMDSGWKYIYDRYNDTYRWVPLNGDVAGLMVRTDTIRDPWFSPAGFNRGNIKNVVKLAFNPNKSQRDQLYKNGINPVTSFPGEGTVLYGDKTLLAKPSAFDRINVRRLFIVLEKAISTAAKFTLFEFNDEFTRAQFRNLVEPFLRDVQGRRGITDFLVVCDETNNTPEIIDRNEFVGDIYIKPNRSINFIQLNFVAVRTGVSFEEIVGNF